MLTVKSYRHEYSVNFENDLSFINEIANKNNIFSIIDENIVNLYPNEMKSLLNKPNYVLKAIEENKTLETTIPIIEQLVKMDSKKETVIVAIGGGITQDLSCFIASILYRGIKWILVPTTLLAQTDSCIGSKSSINMGSYKNLLGTFYPPNEIFVCTKFVKTLTNRDFKSGLGEIAKVLLMSSREEFTEFASDLPDILNGDDEKLMKSMLRTLSFKKKIIEMDEFDMGIRNIMNYGHTFGHAIETATKYLIPHGQAVSIGVLIANEISAKRGLIDSEYNDFIFSNIKKIISLDLVKQSKMDANEIIGCMKMDKKYTGVHNCILLSKDGASKIKGIPEEEISLAISNIFEKLQ